MNILLVNSLSDLSIVILFNQLNLYYKCQTTFCEDFPGSRFHNYCINVDFGYILVKVNKNLCTYCCDNLVIQFKLYIYIETMSTIILTII